MRMSGLSRSFTLPLAGLLLTATAGRLNAQDPASSDSTRAALDSLTDRLDRAERAIERLRQQLEEQSDSKVSSRMRNRVELSGLILLNGVYNDARVNNADVPLFAIAPDTSGLPNAALAGTVRQSRLGITVSGAQALGARLSADLQVDFAGGQQPSSGGRTFPLLRIRTAVVQLDWPHVHLLVGQDVQLISPLNPVSFAAIAAPEFSSAGNLWFWVPQARLTYETGTRRRFGVQGAVLSPMLGSPQALFFTVADSAEKSRRPFVQARAYLGWGDGETESQVGIAVHRGWVATTGDTLLTSKALSADLRLALGEKVLLMAEGFLDGAALGGLGGGGIAQTFGAGNVPVRTRGGWAQLNLRPNTRWELGAGAGIDDPRDADLGPGARLRNVVYEGHLHYRPGGGLIVGATLRHLETGYLAGTRKVNSLGGFMGVVF